MSEIVHCEKCKNTLLDYKGDTIIGGVYFKLYICLKCGNKMALEGTEEEKLNYLMKMKEKSNETLVISSTLK